MKKRILIAAACLLVLSACGGQKTETAEEPKETAAVAAEPEKKEETYPQVTALDEAGTEKLLEVYASVMDETFGADCDWTTPFKEDEVARYYEVKNFKSADELKEYLFTYVDEKLIEDTSFLYDFLVVDDTFCAVRGGRGYGYYGIDPKQFEMTGDTEAKVQFTLMGEAQEGKFVTVRFGEKDGGWKVVSAELPEGFE